MRVVLSPYVHELHWSGQGCAEDCPACLWVEEQAAESRRKSKRKKVSVSVRRAPVGVTSVPEAELVGHAG